MILSFLKKSILACFLFLAAFSLFPESDSDPFSGSVKIEDGENAIGWESTIFGDIISKNEDSESCDDDNEKPVVKNTKQQPLPDKESEQETKYSSDDKDKEAAMSEKKESEKSEDFYSPKDPKWGKYYGKTSDMKIYDKYTNTEEKNLTQTMANIPEIQESSTFPLDLILWSHGGDGYNPMINTGLKVSYMNLYSIVSLGTDFSSNLYRPLSLGLSAGGFYRLSDFSISADLGYEVIWDFSNNSAINDYALGLRAGLSYSIWSWLAISAGAGINYSVFKDSNFGDGRFIPMIFGGFEFNLIK